MWRQLALAAMLAAGGPSAAQQPDYSPDALAILDAEVAEACGTVQGNQVSTNGFIEHDFTGDGQRDLLIQHSEVSCASGRNGFCGAQVCSLLIWVREGGQLVQKVTALGVVTAIGDGPRPVVTFYEHGGSIGSLRWTGTDFEYRKESQ